MCLQNILHINILKKKKKKGCSRTTSLAWFCNYLVLTPYLFRSYVAVPECNYVQAPCKYIICIQWPKTLNRRSMTPDDPKWPWPHTSWDHMCNSTKGLLCPNTMKIHQNIWIRWPFFQKNFNQRSMAPRWPWPHFF